MNTYDVVIVGAGLLGSFTARHLAKRGYRIAVLERENDVSMGISRANTAIIYAGYDMKPGTLKAQLTVEGNAAFSNLCSELDVAFNRTGSLMLASGPRGQLVLKEKHAQGIQNGVPNLQLLNAAEVRKREPRVSPHIIAGLYAPSTGTVNPWQLCLAAAQDAVRHGVDFYFEHEVVRIDSHYSLQCSNGAEFLAPVVVNCTGVDADTVSELVAPVSFRLTLSSGSYIVLDPTASDNLSHVVFFEPERKTKGATFVPTVEGNIMLGPSHEDLDAPSTAPGYATKSAGLEYVRAHSLTVFPHLPLEQVIRSFGTLRPSLSWASQRSDGSVQIGDESIHDLYIAWAKGCPGFLNIAGVKTPGLTCADGIGAYASDLVEEYLQGLPREMKSTPLERKERLLSLSSHAQYSKQEQLSKEASLLTPNSPRFALAESEIVCRCKQITAGQVRAALHTELGARTVDGVKRRVGCGLGRCQGGFCMERVMLLIADELDIDPERVIKDRSGSWIIEEEPAPGAAENDALASAYSARIYEDSSPRVDLLIVGAGAAGLAAATAAVQAGVAPEHILLVERLSVPGGILPQCLHHGFGRREFGGTLSGPEFLAPLLAKFEASTVGVLLNTTVTSISQERTVALATPQGLLTRSPQAIILATGCRERAIGSLPIAGTRPSGVLSAGAAQRMVNLRNWSVGSRIVILGSGDVGMVMADTLTKQGKQVLAVVEQESTVGGLSINRKRYVEAHAIPLLLNSTISRIVGHRRIKGIEIASTQAHPGQIIQADTTATATKGFEQAQAPYLLACDTLIVSVGLIPETDLVTDLGAPSWLFKAGNAERVHSVIENVVANGQAVGAQAAQYLSQ